MTTEMLSGFAEAFYFTIRIIGIAVMFSRHLICRNPALSGSDFLLFTVGL